MRPRRDPRSRLRPPNASRGANLRGVGDPTSNRHSLRRTTGADGAAPSCARHGHELVRRNKMTGRSDNNRSQDQGGHREVLSAKEGGGKGTTVGKRTGREAAMREMSVRGNAKSNRHRKTHRVEPDGAGRKFMHLTRGDLPRESVGEVSRGRSSEDNRVNPAGAKGRRVRTVRSTEPTSKERRGVTRNEQGPAITASSLRRWGTEGRVESHPEATPGAQARP